MKRWLRRIGIGFGALLVVLLIAAAGVYVQSERVIHRRHVVPTASVVIPAEPAAIAEGRRLATVYGCMDGCHGDRGQGSDFIDIPMVARLVAPNLTQAVRRYDAAQLVGIIRGGVRPDGTGVMVMPSESFTRLTDEDVGRIIAYLKTLPLLDGPGPSFEAGPVGRLGLATGRFKTSARMIEDGVEPPAAKSALGQRGRYFARTICTECHGARLQGDANPDFVSPDLRVVSAYTGEEFKRLMRTGTALGGRQLGVMRVRAQQNLSHLTDDEIAALYEYLHTLATN